jgi:hypothetical protein
VPKDIPTSKITVTGNITANIGGGRLHVLRLGGQGLEYTWVKK